MFRWGEITGGTLILLLVLLGIATLGLHTVSAAHGPPDPEIRNVDIPDEVTVDEPFEVSVDGYNDGGRTGGYSTITISSPTLDDSDDDSQIVVTDSFDHEYDEIVSAGETIYDKDDDQMNAEYALVEAGSEFDGQWESGEERSLSVEFTSEETGTFVVYLRVTLTDDEDNTEKYNAPSSSFEEDHQGYAVERYEVDVTGESNLLVGNLRASRDGEAVTRVDRGDRINIEADILNTGDGVGAQYAECYFDRKQVGSEFMEPDPSEDEAVSCTVDTSDFSPGTYEFGIETADDSWYEELVIERPPQPPSISSAYPGGTVTLNSARGDTREFSVEVSDPDTEFDGISTEWLLDGERIGSGSEFTLTSSDVQPGQHTVAAVIDDNQPETDAARREWTVNVVTPPKIASQSPSRESLTVQPGKAQSFSVTVVDEDTPSSELESSWALDGERMTSSTGVTVDAADLQPGRHTLGLTVGDGTDVTDDVTTEWTLRAVASPEIQDLRPGRETVTPGESVPFSVDTRDPNGEGIQSTQWEIGTQRRLGTTVDYVFSSVGTVEVTVIVENAAGLQTTESFEVDVEPTQPSIGDAGPDQSTVEIGEPVQLSTEATDPLDRGISMDYRWESENGPIGDTATTTVRFDEVGRHRLQLTVTNEYGAQTQKTYTVRVQNDQPELQRRHPDPDDHSVLSQKPLQFGAHVTNRDSAPATVELQVDDATVGSKRMTGDEEEIGFSHTFERPGDRTVTYVVQDSHGAENQILWDITVENRPPDIRSTTPEQGEITVMSGESREFRVRDVDPEQRDVDLT